jgi:hypothetical protein
VAFVAAVAAPRPGFVVHQHGGGEHRHLHLAPAAADSDIDRLLAEALGSPRHHHHSHPAEGQPHFEAAANALQGTAHWHDQAPFQPTVYVATASLGGLLAFQAPAVALPLAAADRPLGDTRARSPPA